MGGLLCGRARKKPFKAPKKTPHASPPPSLAEVSKREKQRFLAPPTPAIVAGSGRPAAAAAKSLQSCPTPCDPIDGSPPGSSVPGILQAGILVKGKEWALPEELFKMKIPGPCPRPWNPALFGST